MIGDRSITLLAFLAAALLHFVVFVLASYVPIAKLALPAPPSRTRYIVKFQQPAPTTTPTSVPIPVMPAPPITPVRPVPVQPLPRQPTPSQEPVRVSPRHESSAVAHTPRPKPVDQVKRPRRIAARQPADVNVQRTQRIASPKSSAMNEPVVPRSPPPQQPPTPARLALPPPQPTASPMQDLQLQYLAMVSKALQRHKRYPRVARRRGLSGRVVLDFVILPNGQIAEARIIASQSTRHGILNQAALRALKQASPLPPFPKALKKPSLRVTLPILYKLTER